MRRKISEADVEAHFVKRMKALGAEVRKLAWVGRRDAPDRFVKILGEPVALVEIKAPDADMNTPHVRAQQREHEKLRAAGVHVCVIDSIEQIDRLWPRPSEGELL